MKVAAIGLGYVGTVTAACLASRGHDVWGVDVDAVKGDEIRGVRSPVADPGLDALVAQAADVALQATISCSEALDRADVSLVCVGTPSSARSSTALSYVRRAVDEIEEAVRIVRPRASRQHSVVRSTAPPGTVINEMVDRVTAHDGHKVALLGLSFKMNTDDLRESPYVELAKRLLGKGFDVRIFDPIVNPARLIGAKRRRVESKLPHLGRLLAHKPSEALRGADVAIVSSSDHAVLDALLMIPPPQLIDIGGRLGSEVESLPGYERLGW
jgi:UDP-glucose 6-dehydrogenase